VLFISKFTYQGLGSRRVGLVLWVLVWYGRVLCTASAYDLFMTRVGPQRGVLPGTYAKQTYPTDLGFNHGEL